MREMTVTEMKVVAGARPSVGVGDALAMGTAVGGGIGVGVAQAGGLGLAETALAGGVVGVAGAAVVGAAIGGYYIGTTIENAIDGDEGYPWP